MTTYTYTINPFNADQMILQIQQSTIVTALDNITSLGSVVNITFKADLSTADKTTLDGLVAAHTGVEPPQNQLQKVSVDQSTAFASKTLDVNGVTKNLYKRFTGASFPLAVGSNTFTWTQASFPWAKFLGVEVIGAELGDVCSLIVLDTATGTYSGVPNAPLNQFAYTANVAPNFYSHKSEYDADIFQGIQIKFVYTSISAKNIYINFDMNEVK